MTRQLRLAILVGCLEFLITAAPAWGVYLAESGGVATAVGSFTPGDEHAFAAFLAQPRAVPLRVIYLDSRGGMLGPAVAIGRMVRRAGLATAVMADRAACDSACTLVFAGGVRRHYVGGDRIHEGFTAMTGLGFHPAHRRGYGGNPSTLSAPASQNVRAYYAEMGMPRAAELMDRAAFNSVFRPSGRTALELRIATSLSPP
jgi:hypothetical protein